MTKQAEFAGRDRAIEKAAREGKSWGEQALAGLAALPPGTRGPGKRFTYWLTCASSPLTEPAKSNQWSHVFTKALKTKVLEKTGRIVTVRDTSRTNFKPEYRRPDPAHAITVYVDPATEAEFIRGQLKQAMALLKSRSALPSARIKVARAKIADAIKRLAPFIDL